MVVAVTGYQIGTLIFTILIIVMAIKTSLELIKNKKND
jgi:heme/copper-type cytochrome/quinol oxidase subunit 4